MNRLGIVFILAGALLYGVSEVDRRSELALRLVELDGLLPLPSWVIALIVGVAIAVFGGKRSKKRQSLAIEPHRREEPRPGNEDQQPPFPGGGRPERIELQEAADRLDLPRGASILIDRVKYVPFTLRLERTTPEGTRRSIDRFASFLAGIPAPRRASIYYIDVIDSGVPKQNQALGALRKYIPAGAIAVTSQKDRVDIQFNNPDSFWEESPNLLRSFL